MFESRRWKKKMNFWGHGGVAILPHTFPPSMMIPGFQVIGDLGGLGALCVMFYVHIHVLFLFFLLLVLFRISFCYHVLILTAIPRLSFFFLGLVSFGQNTCPNTLRARPVPLCRRRVPENKFLPCSCINKCRTWLMETCCK